MSKLLTIGMSTYDDYHGVYFSIQSLKMHHEVCKRDDVEIIIIDNGSEDAKTIGLKILHAIQSFDFDGIGKMTASIGVASYHNEETAINLLNRADACMYHAKEHGRNQVIVDTDLA